MVQLFGAGAPEGSDGKLRALVAHDAFDLGANLSELRLCARLEAHDQDRAGVRSTHEPPLRGAAGAWEGDTRAVDVEDGVALFLVTTGDGGDDLKLDRV